MFTLLFATATLIGCSSSSTSTAGSTGARTTVRRGSSTLIARAELAALPTGTNALEAIQRLRPTMLRTRGTDSIMLEADPIHIFLNASKLGGPDALTGVQANELEEIRFLNASEATQKWGTGYTNGAIQLASRGK
jgi:hypothetical protein